MPRVTTLVPILAMAAGLPVMAQFHVRLSPETTKAFDDYVFSAENAMTPAPRVTALVKPGETRVAPVRGDPAFDVADGLIHDWVASAVAPGTSVEKVLGILQNYAAYKKVYAPEVAESRLIGRSGNHWHPFLKLVTRKGLTSVAYNTEYDVEFRPLEGGRWAVISRSTRVAQLDGKDEFEPGYGDGYLWRLNAYWFIEPRPQGIYLECRTISLSRDIPPGLGWALRPVVTSFPRDSLQKTLEATLRAVK
ncbi:MAG TPA: hypothetical protein VN841_24325 [Bryobacteraceae bacterium]|nr:hypothetical protein [Bryobacteraceae bacterium]